MHATRFLNIAGVSEEPDARSESPAHPGLDLERLRRVLVVDDDDACRSFLVEAFETLGCHALQAADAAEALRLLAEYQPDLVCSDLRMPGMDGIEFLTLLRAHAPSLPCVVISGCAESAILSEAVRLGVTACLPKPVRIESLLEVLRHIPSAPNRHSASRSVDPEPSDGQGRGSDARPVLGEIETHLLRKTSQLSLLTQFATALQGSGASASSNADGSARNRVASLVGRSLEIARLALNAEQLALCLLEEGRVRLVSVNGPGEPRLPVDAAARHLTALGMHEPWQGAIDERPTAAAPLMINGAALGFLCAGRSAVTRPFAMSDAELLAAFAGQTAVALENATLARQLEQAFQSSVTTLIVTLEAKHKYTEGHSLRVAEYARAIATRLELSPLEHEQVGTAALLHDLGKVGVRDEVLEKPGKLDRGEWDAMRQHPLLGARILGALGFLAEEARIVRHHHERVDGTGYPDGLAGEAIPFASRIIAVADSFDAMRSSRSYRPEMSEDAALWELRRGAGTQFDPRVVQAFCAWRSRAAAAAAAPEAAMAPLPRPTCRR